MELLLGFVVAIGVTMALIPPLIKLAPRWHFVDVPQERKVHVNPIPRVGGLAMAAGVLLALIVYGRLTTSAAAMIASIVVLVVFGAWDDRATLSAGPKFVGQALAALIVMYFGSVCIGTVTLTDRYAMPDWIAWPLTFFFLVGATNAINLADGLDGLAGGTTLMCLAGVAVLAFTVNNVQVGGMALLIVGAVLGFLRYNTYPARVFMGDTGSQLLGFSAAVLSVLLTQDPAAPFSSALPLLLLGVPIIDTLAVMIGRIVAGRSPFKADRTHIHHRLLSLGFDHHEAVMVIYLAQGVFFVAAWQMRYESDVIIAVAFAAMAVMLLAPLTWAHASGWRMRARAAVVADDVSQFRRWRSWLAAPQRLPRWCLGVLLAGWLALSMLVWRGASAVSQDAAIVALFVALTGISVLIWRRHASDMSWLDKSVLYFYAVFTVYQTALASRADGFDMRWVWLVIVTMAVAIAIRIRLSNDRRFVVTPLDVLVVIVAAVAPNMPNPLFAADAGSIIAQLIVLFYSIETLVVAAQQRWRWLVVCASVLSMLGAGWPLFTI